MKIEYIPFAESMLPQAAKLLAERHARHRKNLPLLPQRFENPEVATKAVEALWQKKLKGGYVAFRSGKLIAYLMGETSADPWGRSGYVYLPGYALAENESPAVLQDLYALLGEDWVKKGCFNHYLYVSSADAELLNALFDIGFGKERVDALLDLSSDAIPRVDEAKNITLRRAGKGDATLLGNFSDVIMRALEKAPHWHPTMPEDWDELHEGWSELASDKEWIVWLALDGPHALGMIGFRPEAEEPTQMLVPPSTMYLSVAATQPEARGRGVGMSLSWHGLAQAREAGYQVCYTNWISPNFLASRFWPRFGFKDVAYRVAKKVNPMIAWAKDE
ncbi:MAG TPA: GNAT family N-acetyltransferase [Anaerolineales bacterium]|nr:GNAT family N-acetyltransferase [Anaerolineales bacterium]